MIGHSIIDGSAQTNYSNLQAELKVAITNARIFNINTRANEVLQIGVNNRNVGVDAGKWYGPELQYAYNEALYSGELCHVYKRGASGSALGFSANNWNYASYMHYIDQSFFDVINYRDALIAAGDGSIEIKYKLIVWLGENDSLYLAEFKTNLTNLIRAFRHELGQEMPVALDRYHNAGTRRDDIIAIASELPSIYLINSDDLIYPDGSHPTQPEIWGARAQLALRDL